MDDPPKPRDLEQRTFLFAQSIRAFVKRLPRTIGNIEDVRQLVRASGSVAANWIEADEALSKKDFLVRAKICRKEAKECRLFLRLIEAGSANSKSREALSEEARGANLNFFGDHFKDQRIMRALFDELKFGICLGFGNWDLGFCEL